MTKKIKEVMDKEVKAVIMRKEEKEDIGKRKVIKEDLEKTRKDINQNMSKRKTR